MQFLDLNVEKATRKNHGGPFCGGPVKTPQASSCRRLLSPAMEDATLHRRCKFFMQWALNAHLSANSADPFHGSLPEWDLLGNDRFPMGRHVGITLISHQKSMGNRVLSRETGIPADRPDREEYPVTCAHSRIRAWKFSVSPRSEHASCNLMRPQPNTIKRDG